MNDFVDDTCHQLI